MGNINSHEGVCYESKVSVEIVFAHVLVVNVEIEIDIGRMRGCSIFGDVINSSRVLLGIEVASRCNEDSLGISVEVTGSPGKIALLLAENNVTLCIYTPLVLSSGSSERVNKVVVAIIGLCVQIGQESGHRAFRGPVPDGGGSCHPVCFLSGLTELQDEIPSVFLLIIF